MPRSEGVSVGREGLLGGEVPRQLHSTPGGLHPVTGSPYPIAQRAWTHTRQTFRSFAGRHPCGVLTPPSRTEDTEWPLPRSSIFRQRTVWCHADVRRVPARDCPPKAFRRGLELGAGDAFQSSLLAHYVDFLVVTDFSDQILEHEDTPQRVHRVCDAEQVDEAFAAGEFDLVFSSNMMEHVPRPQRVLAGVQRVLSDDGIAIHVMPSPFLKACHMLGFHVDAVLTRLERCSNRRLPKLEDTGPFLWTATITSCWRNGVTDVYAGSFGRFHMEFHEATGKSSSCFAASRGKRCSRAQDSSWFRPFADRCLRAMASYSTG